MNEHSFCTIWNVTDGSIVNNAIMCKVLTLLFKMHIDTRLYIFLNKRTYCYILFSKPQPNTPFKLLLIPTDNHENFVSIHTSKCMIIQIWRSHMHQYIDVSVSNTEHGRLFSSSEVHVHKALYLGHFTTDSDECTLFLHDLKCTRW